LTSFQWHNLVTKCHENPFSRSLIIMHVYIYKRTNKANLISAPRGCKCAYRTHSAIDVGRRINTLILHKWVLKVKLDLTGSQQNNFVMILINNRFLNK
jgi:hypothetical protein